jgi:hypothetical protein
LCGAVRVRVSGEIKAKVSRLKFEESLFQDNTKVGGFLILNRHYVTAWTVGRSLVLHSPPTSLSLGIASQ